MQQYSPFDRPIGDLQSIDLAILKSVSEGWYVDYKRDLIDARAMAKALSAFANTYGGWLFIGVDERSKDDPVAHKFPGLTEREVDVALQRLRKSAADHISPTPFFRTTVVRGPCTEIDLAAGLSVVVVEVPQSPTAPHIHRDGRIYRRVADGSEPRPETDRFLLDQLWRRTEPIREMTREWIEQDPEFSKAEAETPYLRLLLCIDPWRQREIRLDTPLSQIRKVMSGQDRNLPSIPFDTIYSTTGGFVARQVRNNDPHDFVMTWRCRHNLRCDVVIPLPLYAPGDFNELALVLDGYQHGVSFIDILRKHGFAHPRIVDLNLVMNILTGVVSQYRRLLQMTDAQSEFFFKARVLNAWRIVPFVDTASVLGEFSEHGLPMVLDNTVTVPTGSDPDSFVHIGEQKPEFGEQKSGAIQAGVVFGLIATAFGVPFVLEGETESDSGVVPYSEFLAAGARAMTVQQGRSERRRSVSGEQVR